MAMKLHFYKYEGTGNDFILLDNREGIFTSHLDSALIKRLCDRRFGIGADGLMILQRIEGYDFEMLYYNADGNAGSMCGNGGRCIAAFAKYLGVTGNESNFLAVDGPHYAKISDINDRVSLQMIDVSDISEDGEAFVLDTGSPHYVLPVKDLVHKNVFQDGQQIRYNPIYAEKGINVNYVEDLGDHYYVRTYERGVEDETFACGTGVTAVAIAMARLKKQEGFNQIKIVVLGGELQVSFNYSQNRFTEVFLEGPAKLVFEGYIDI